MAKAGRLWVPDRAEVIFIQHSPAKGGENFHPMLVCSPGAFNAATGIVIGFPMTHSESHKDNPFAVAIAGPKGIAYVLAHQPKSFDWRQREAKPHPWGGGHFAMMAEVMAKLDDICGIADAIAPIKSGR